MSINIDGKIISEKSPCFIIAEAGSNHNGKYDQAIKLIDIAVEAGADAVKFQLFMADKIAARTEHEVAKLNSDYGTDLFELYKNSEFPREWIPDLMDYCRERNITFLATPFDYEAVDLLEKNNISAYKVASFELVHLPLLKYIAKKDKPMILSTGMATLAEVEEAIQVIRGEGNNKIVILHCGISYPMPFSEVNLKAMSAIKNSFNVITGYSDHTCGNVVPVLVVGMDGRVIEKHFTLDKTLKGPDHEFALNPVELKQMINSVRNAEKAKGDGIKRPADIELIHKKRGRRSLFVNKRLKAGDILTNEDIEVLRPGVGLKPKYLDIVNGAILKKDINSYDPITWDVLI